VNLGLPDDPVAGVRLAVDRGRRRLDVGRSTARWFAVMAGMGFDAAMMDDASTRLKARIGPAAYVVSAVKHLLERSMRVEIHIDDDPPRRRHARSVLVGNVGRLQGGIRLLADAEPDSGVMDMAMIAPGISVTGWHWPGAYYCAARGCPGWRCCAAKGFAFSATGRSRVSWTVT